MHDPDADTDSELLIRLTFLLDDINETIREAHQRAIDTRVEITEYGTIRLFAELKSTILI